MKFVTAWVVTFILGSSVSNVSYAQSGTVRPNAPDVTDGSRNWPYHDLTQGGGRYSLLTRINQGNIGQLGLAWHYDIDEPWPVEATPIVIDGVMYTTAAWGKVYALDAKTGKELWRYDPKVPLAWEKYDAYQAHNRGVAVYKGKVYVAAFDGRLIAIDAKTGKRVWEQATLIAGWPYASTGAPIVVKGKVIIGNAGADFGVRGYITAYDAESGKQVWRFFTVPGNPADGFENEAMRMAAKTWKGEWWKTGGGGTVWDSMVYDPDLDLLYIGVGNGGPWNQKLRSPGGGDNLFLSSIVALKPDKGEYVWHYQETPGDTWDYTAVQPMILADLTIDGRVRKVIMQAPKNGFFYVIDRVTGKLISAAKHTSTNWATRIDMETGRPVEVPAARFPEGKTVAVQPSSQGGHNWQPMAFSPLTGWVYFGSVAAHENYGFEPGYTFERGYINTGACSSGALCQGADRVQVHLPVMPDQNTIVAWDPVHQQEIWRVAYPPGRESGVLATASDLLFHASIDSRFIAQDAVTGRELWSYPITQNRGGGGPVSYEIDGEQYIAVAVGRGLAGMIKGPIPRPQELPSTNRVLAFRLGGKDSVPVIAYSPQPLTAPPKQFASAATIEKGRLNFYRTCWVCHGADAGGDHTHPDLRFSPLLASKSGWAAIVLDGLHAPLGMRSFKPLLAEDTAESVRAYVISKANEYAAENSEAKKRDRPSEFQ